MRIINITLYLLLFFVPFHLSAQESITISLKLNLDYDMQGFYYIDFKKEGQENRPPVVAEEGETNIGKAQGDVLVKAIRLENDSNSYLVKVDTDGDKDFDDEKEYEILPDSTIIVNVLRQYDNTKEIYLPYRIKYWRYRNWWHIFRSDFLNEILMWAPAYRVEGVIHVDSCETLVALADHNADGHFNYKDPYAGSNLCIDRNRDGMIWGRAEWQLSSEIIEFCNRYFVIDSIAPDGSLLTLAETELRIPNLGEKTPFFSYTTIDNEILTPEILKGEIYLLDYWTSSCIPCISEFPRLQELEKEKFNNKIKIITISVDNSNRVENAFKVLEEYKITWKSVIEGKGRNDLFWKMISAMKGHRAFSTPLYVLVDQNGVIQYAGYGGVDLTELEKKISEMSL
jgi:thiol-disulfide isomerase/thioredoxin